MTDARVTRGKTRPGRLGRVDAWLVDTARELLARRDGAWADAVVVDLGLGARPDTTLELRAALDAVAPDVLLVAVDTDGERVARATEAVDHPRIAFREGGFDLPVDRPVRLIRAMNVLRQYPPHAVPDAHTALGAPLLPGGLLVEGTTDPEGHRAAAHLLRRTEAGLVREGLWVSTDGARGFAPILFRDVLPRDLRGHTQPASPVRTFLDAWTEAWEEVRATADTPQAAFAASARALATRRDDVDATWAHAGHLVWRPEGGVPMAPPAGAS